MASRKEEKEKRRSERLAAERRETSGQRLRLILGYAVAGVLGLAVVAGVVIALASGGDDGGGSGAEAADDCEEAELNTQVGVARGTVPDCREGAEPPAIEQGDLVASVEAAGCELDEDLPEEGNQHFTDEERDPGWETSPPTSGDHYGTNTEVGSGALADGAYAEPPSMARAVHALEHGRVAIQYSPDLPEEDQLVLKGLFEEDSAGVMLFPNPDMEHAVAATAWRQRLACPSYEGGATIDAVRNFRDTKRAQGPEDFPIYS